MTRNAFGRLCQLFEFSGGLRATRHVTVMEQVAIFLSIIPHHKKNCVVKHDFVRSGRTISKHFHSVLKGCLGALDGTHVDTRVPEADKGRYRNRKGQISINVLGVCSIDGKFTYVLSGWKGFLTPYHGVRYHLRDWDRGSGGPQNWEELFNLRHSSARNVIERTFGLLKTRWGILRSHMYYTPRTHNRIIMACCLLHNFLLMEMPDDPIVNETRDEVDNNLEEGTDFVSTVEATTAWSRWPDELASNMYNEWLNGG
ncbi:UNVERIFIED_CONTAM: hypothetical protein Sradi_1884200 [Sesamum radiatum]|uniref:DDE Tnp4 domain-containing protein n=1 Tax=Sesamum radiatum TaxID=300843 RepID=A0AAW2TXE8_SESRA